MRRPRMPALIPAALLAASLSATAPARAVTLTLPPADDARLVAGEGADNHTDTGNLAT